MDREKLQTFVLAAEDDLASVRSSLLIVAQACDASDLTVPRRTLAWLKTEASANEMPAIVDLCMECEASLDNLASADKLSPAAVHATLDIVARIEAAVWAVPMNSDDFLSDVSGFVDATFDEFLPARPPAEPIDEEFEIDEETLDIFRSEADDLLANIAENLRVLSSSTLDQNAIWDIRRNAHTFKGAAGIVGMKEASEIAHRMEDLLDKIVEMRREAVPQVIDFLGASASRLSLIVAAKNTDEDAPDLEDQYAEAMACVCSNGDPESTSQNDNLPETPVPAQSDAVRSTTTPIVRVSLDRLDELIKISRSLIVNRSALAERFAEFSTGGADSNALTRLDSIFEAQRNLTDEMQAKLLQIRMVKFGTLETRLSRTVNMTCDDEKKKAVLEIENGDVEIDTQVIDALIEPLLHLLKNAVVHGIESPDTRRMIGKAERGKITIKLEADEEALVMSINDDGCGISVQRVKEKAVASGIISEEKASYMDDREAMQLIFDRGLTTAGKIDLNAGRGVGMSIVKEAVENRGGRIIITSAAQRGTTFTILMPLAVTKPEVPEPEVIEISAESITPPLILIVDDSASVRRQSTKLVEQAGVRVITANNGAEALELLLSGAWEPDLILSDVEMPQIDGWEFLEYVKTDANFGHIPVVMVTSLDAETHRKRAFDLGATDYLIKPLNGMELARVLENLGANVAA